MPGKKLQTDGAGVLSWEDSGGTVSADREISTQAYTASGNIYRSSNTRE